MKNILTSVFYSSVLFRSKVEQEVVDSSCPVCYKLFFPSLKKLIVTDFKMPLLCDFQEQLLSVHILLRSTKLAEQDWQKTENAPPAGSV